MEADYNLGEHCCQGLIENNPRFEAFQDKGNECKGMLRAALPASLISRHPAKSRWVREVSWCRCSKQASVMVATLEQPPSFRHARAGMEAAT